METALARWTEKRGRPRNLTNHNNVRVLVVHEGKRHWGKVLNLSVGGGLLHFDESFGATKNSGFDCVFTSTLNNGKLTKIYFKHATVIHVTGGNVGVAIGNRTIRL